MANNSSVIFRKATLSDGAQNKTKIYNKDFFVNFNIASTHNSNVAVHSSLL